MKFRLWVGDENNRSEEAQFSAPDLDTAIAHVERDYLSDLAIGWEAELDNGSGPETTIWDLFRTLNVGDYGMTKEDLEELKEYEDTDSPFETAYYMLEETKDFADWGPDPYSV
jgi:hypothetical protein